MASIKSYNKIVQCNLMLEEKLERSNLQLIYKRSKLIYCNIKPERKSVKTSTGDLEAHIKSSTLPTANAVLPILHSTECLSRHSVGTNTDLDKNLGSVFIDRILYALRTVEDFRNLRYEVNIFCLPVIWFQLPILFN